jgi:hypothetical protein
MTQISSISAYPGFLLSQRSSIVFLVLAASETSAALGMQPVPSSLGGVCALEKELIVEEVLREGWEGPVL